MEPTLKGQRCARRILHSPGTTYLGPEIPSDLHNALDKGDKEAYCITSGTSIASAPTGPNPRQGQHRGTSPSQPGHAELKALPLPTTHMQRKIPTRQKCQFNQAGHVALVLNHHQLSPGVGSQMWCLPPVMAWTQHNDIDFVWEMMPTRKR